MRDNCYHPALATTAPGARVVSLSSDSYVVTQVHLTADRARVRLCPGHSRTHATDTIRACAGSSHPGVRSHGGNAIVNCTHAVVHI